MKKTIVVMAGVLMLGAMGRGALAAEASLSLDVASAYVFRGATFNDGLVAQPGLSVSGLPIDIGVWANIDLGDYGGTVADGQISEIDLCGSYTLTTSVVEVAVGYTEYAYPSGGGDADRELSLSFGLPVVLSPSLTVAYGVGGGIDGTLYVEAGVGHELALGSDTTLELGVTAAFLSPDEGADGFSHWTATAGLSYACVSASVTYVGRIDDDVLSDVEDGGSYDVEVYGMVGVSHDF